MERMGDILARTATRRARLHGTSAAKFTKNKSTVAPTEHQADTARTETTPSRTPLARPQRAGFTGPLKQSSGPQTLQSDSAPDATARPAQPDALDSDQILELPVRANGASRSAALIQRSATTRQLSVPTTSSTTPDASRDVDKVPTPLQRRRLQTMATPRMQTTSGNTSQEPPIPPAMTPLRDVAQGFLARRPARTSEQAAPNADVETTPSEQSNQTEAPTPRKARAKKTSSEPEVCPYCGGAGYLRLEVPVDDPAFGKPVPCQCREREWEERRRQDLRRFSSLDPFRDKTFATFDQKTPGLREAYDTARQYADDPQGWLVLRGGYGCGKTHLAAAIANAHLSAGAHVFFSIVPDLLDHLRAAFAPNSEMRYDEMFERVREAGLLVLDDLGAENSTAWATEKLFQIINYRYNFRMPTVITTNSRLLSHMDERIASRLADIGLVQTIVIEAQDYRKRHAAGAPRAAQNSPRGRNQAR